MNETGKSIIELAFAMSEAVNRFAEMARRYFYHVMLSGYACQKCNGGLEMVKEGLCRCQACGTSFDPTIAFQQCSACGGKPRLKVRRYQCGQCAADIQSRFLFDGLVFDAEYFRQKMAESRLHRRELRERVRLMLAESRSEILQPEMAELNSMPGLLEALNALTQGLEPSIIIPPGAAFDLKRYQAHIQAHLQPFPVTLEQIPPLGENSRKDKIWRFIALIFMAHARITDIWQDGQSIMVMKHETYPERQRVPGDIEEADGIEGPVGRVEA